jgi:hypothetical protein
MITKPTLRDNGHETTPDRQKMITMGQTKGISKPYLQRKNKRIAKQKWDQKHREKKRTPMKLVREKKKP